MRARGPPSYHVLSRAHTLSSFASAVPEPLAAAGDRGDEANLLGAVELLVDSTGVADVHSVDVDVHERPQRAALVEDEVGDRKRTKSVCDGVGLDLEAALAADLGGEHPRQQDYGQSAASTERMGGSCEAASLQLSPPSAETKTEPL
jgi:hypothetical protein